MWDLCWTQWHWDKFISEWFVLPCQYHFMCHPWYDVNSWQCNWITSSATWHVLVPQMHNVWAVTEHLHYSWYLSQMAWNMMSGFAFSFRALVLNCYWHQTGAGIIVGWMMLPGRGNTFFSLIKCLNLIWGAQSMIQWVPGFLSVGVKQLGHETDNTAASTAKVRNEGNCASAVPCFCVSFWWWEYVLQVHTYCQMGLLRSHKFVQFRVHQLDQNAMFRNGWHSVGNNVICMWVEQSG